MWRGRARLGIGLLAWAWVGACAGEPTPARGVVLVTIDTLRADHLGCYGYARNTSPALDALAETATLYTRAMASSPWTLPTHASLFTGLDPFEHGARTFRTAPAGSIANPLDPRHLTLAEALRDEGFRTAAFVANEAYLAQRHRLDQGFEVYEVASEAAVQMLPRVFGWLDRHAKEPFFLFLNFMDAHRPYNTTPRPDALPPPPDRDRPELLDRLYGQVMPGNVPVSPELVRRVILQYDAGIANADLGLDRLFARLRELGVWDETLIVVTSDHGEYFGEHSLVEHSKDVYQEAVWIPLVVKEPGQHRGRRMDVSFSSTHLPGLVASSLGGDRAARLGGHFPRRPGGPIVAENYYTRARDLGHPVWGHRFDRVRRAIYDWPYKLIQSSDGHHELYDVETDPLEQHNLFESRSETAARLARVLEERLNGAPEVTLDASAAEMGEPERGALRALGYVDS